MFFGDMLVHLLSDEVSVLRGLLPQTNHLYPGVEVLTCVITKYDLPLLRVSLLVALLVAVVILEARLHMMRLM